MLLGQITSMNSLSSFVVFVFFPVQQWPFQNNIVTDRFKFFWWLYSWMCRKKSVPSFSGTQENGHSWHHSKFIDRAPTKINKNGAVAKVYKNFGGTRDTLRHWKTFRVTSDEMPVLLILSWCYFSCLKMYSDKFFNAYFYEQMFFEIFVARETQVSFFWKIIAWTVKFSLTNLHVSWRSWF